MEGTTQRQVHLMDYWQVLVKRRWIVYSAVLLVTGLVTLGSFLMRPVYTATVQLQIEKFGPNVDPFQEVMTTYNDWRDDFYETQSRLIQSKSVARAVVRELGLRKHPLFEIPAAGSGEPLSGEQIESLLAEQVRGGLGVNMIRNSRLANITYESHDRELTADVANAVAAAYIEFNAATAYNATERASVSMGRQVELLREEIDEKERQLQQYARDQDIIPLDEQQDITSRKLNDLNSAYTKAQTSRIEKEARYAALQETPIESLPEMMTNDLLGTLAAKHAELEREYAQMSTRFKPDWPAMARLKSELERTGDRLDSEKKSLHQRLLGAAREQYQAALHEERSLGEALDRQKREAQETSLRSIEYNNLKSEVENRRETLEALMKRQTETNAKAGLMDNPLTNVRIVDAAEVPRFPARPRKAFNFLLSLVAGLGLGLGLAFFFDYMDDSINHADDLDKAAGLPCLGIVPLHDAPTRRLRVVRPRHGEESVTRAEIDLAALCDARSQTSEMFRELRTTLLVSSPGGPPRNILVTSSQPREGKTSTALNLAITLAQLNKRVLVVDADLRKPRVHKALGLTNDAGLSNILSGSKDPAPLVVPTTAPRVFMLSSGPPPPNPAELLDSSEFAEFMARLDEDSAFDHVIFDSPPVLSVADAAIMAARMDGVILVVQSGATPRQLVGRAADKLRLVKARVLGALLNMADSTSPDYYHYRGYYGERAETGDEKRRTDQAGASS